MTDKKIKLEKPFPEEDLGFEKIFSNTKMPQIELTTPFVVEDDISALRNWDVFNGEDFSNMFANCKSLIDISALRNWDVSNDEDFSDMFKNCPKVKEIEWQND